MEMGFYDQYVTAPDDPHVSDYDIAGLESESSYLARCNIHIVIAGKVILASDESVSV